MFHHLTLWLSRCAHRLDFQRLKGRGLGDQGGCPKSLVGIRALGGSGIRHGPRGSILGPFGEPESIKNWAINRYDEPSGSWSGPWGPGWVSEGSCVDFGVSFGIPGLDFELHFGTFLGAKMDEKLGRKSV